MTRRHRLAGIALAAALGLAACAGSDGTTASPTDAPSAAATDVPATDVPATDVPATDVPATDPPASEPAGACVESSEPGTVQAVMDGFAFSPSTIEASVGDVITFTNRDAAPHTATTVDAGCTTPKLGSGDTGSLVFSEPGSYPFFCRIHPDMTGTFEIAG
ncbi:MAG: cupredoxin domain-containing protein [Candidatus Limnocylindria bacterium]